MMELVDMQGLKPCLVRGPGSSPGVGMNVLLTLININCLKCNILLKNSYLFIYASNVLHIIILGLFIFIILSKSS